MALRKFGEGKVLRDEEQVREAASAEPWTEEDQQELEEELDEK